MPRQLSVKLEVEVAVWAGAKVRNIVGLGEVSAAGSPGETGVILLEVPDTSDAAKAGFSAGDACWHSMESPSRN